MTLAIRDAALGDVQPMPAGPVTFDGLLGWYSPGLSRRGVVMCGTLGYEQISAYRGWRALAADLAAAGHPTLRFDYPGEGDSTDPAAPGVEPLLAAIRRAVRFLRDEGADEIVLLGLRLGATFAALAAEEADIDRLVLLAPFASGRAYLREMTMRTKTIDQLPDGRPFPQDPAAPVFGGFRPPAGLLAALARIDLTKVPPAPVPSVLLLGPDPAGLAGRLREAGSHVTSGAFPGLAAFLSNALISETPHGVFAQVLGFIGEGAHLRADGRPPSLPAAEPAALAGDGWSETLIRFGGNVGVICAPRRAAPGMPTLLFVNSGVNPRSGYGRQTTDLARDLAQAGVKSLRMDLHGVGDGDDRADGKPPLYAEDAVEEIIGALDRLDEGHGVVLTGSCSGAYLGFHVLCRDPRIRAAVLVNLYCFDWDPQTDLSAALKPSFRSPASYASLLRQPDAWRRVLRGEVRVGAILARLAGVALGRSKGLAMKVLRPFPSARSVAGRITQMRKRGARLVLVFSEGEAGLGEVATHLGRSPDRLAKRLGHPMVLLRDTDHNLSTEGAQDRLKAILRDVLTGLSTGSPSVRR